MMSIKYLELRESTVALEDKESDPTEVTVDRPLAPLEVATTWPKVVVVVVERVEEGEPRFWLRLLFVSGVRTFFRMVGQGFPN